MLMEENFHSVFPLHEQLRMNHIQNGCNRILDMLIIASEKRILRIIKLLTPDTRFKRPIITSKLSSSVFRMSSFHCISNDSNHSQIHLKMKTFCIFFFRHFRFYSFYSLMHVDLCNDTLFVFSELTQYTESLPKITFENIHRTDIYSLILSPFSFSVQFFKLSRYMHRSIVVLLYSFFMRMVESGFKPFFCIKHRQSNKRCVSNERYISNQRRH